MLGQEFALIVYDARGGLNLDALAIASGTLQQEGVLLILLPQWAMLSTWQDPDSVRWSGENDPILTPHFLHYFQQKVRDYGFPVYHTFSLRYHCRINQPVRSIFNQNRQWNKHSYCTVSIRLLKRY